MGQHGSPAGGCTARRRHGQVEHGHIIARLGTQAGGGAAIGQAQLLRAVDQQAHPGAATLRANAIGGCCALRLSLIATAGHRKRHTGGGQGLRQPLGHGAAAHHAHAGVGGHVGGGGVGGSGCGRLGQRVGVEAALGLAAQQAAIDQLALHQRGHKAFVVEIGLIHRLGDREIGVVADEVHQLARPHPEAHGPQAGIQLGWGGGLLLQQGQGFGVIGPGNAVDDEAGRGAGMHRHLAPHLGEPEDGLGHGGCGLQTGHHLHQLHQWNGVEKMHAHQPLRVVQTIGNGRDRDGRGVGSQHAIGRHDALQLPEQAALGLQLFDNGFHHQVGMGRALQRRNGGDALQRLGRRFRRQLAFGGQGLQGGGQLGARLVGSAFAHVKQHDRVPGQRGHLGNARAHDARAHHQHGGVI